MSAKPGAIRSFFFPTAPDVPEAISALAKDDKWTISQERVFMEDLVYKRLTLFLAVAAALTTAAINLRDDLLVSIPLLFLGTVLCWVLQQTVHRAQLKLDIILKMLFADARHPAGYVDAVLNDESRVKWVGYLVPTAICLLLTLLTAAEVAIFLGLVSMPAGEG